MCGFAMATVFRQPEWKKHVGENIGDARFTDQRHLRRCGIGGEGVMKIPKRMFQGAKEIVDRAYTAVAKGALECRPLLDERSERGDAALRMIDWTGATQPPDFGRQN